MLEPADGQFLSDLHRMGPATVQDIGRVMRVTATAVRQRLTRLQASGLIERTLVRSGRGRPHHCYRLTGNGLRQLGDNYADLAMILWRELQSIPDDAIRQQVTDRIQAAFVARFGRRIGGSMVDRLRGFAATLSDRGFDISVEHRDGVMVLRENSCPYQEMAEQDRSICQLELAVFEQALGVKLSQTKCCLNGDHCCEFEVSSDLMGVGAGNESSVTAG
jgi:predicted ArsR family transcriptional regulator